MVELRELELTMSGERNSDPSKKVIPFSPSKTFRPDVRDQGDPLDRSGQAIVELLQQAAETANSNCDRAMELAHKLSLQLRAAEERIRELEIGYQPLSRSRAARREMAGANLQGH